MLYKFILGHNTGEATKKICHAKGEGAVDHTTLTRWFKKFLSDQKNFDNQAKSGRPKTMDSEAIRANQINFTWRVLGELIISQSSVVCHLHDLNKSNHSC